MPEYSRTKEELRCALMQELGATDVLIVEEFGRVHVVTEDRFDEERIIAVTDRHVPIAARVSVSCAQDFFREQRETDSMREQLRKSRRDSWHAHILVFVLVALSFLEWALQ